MRRNSSKLITTIRCKRTLTMVLSFALALFFGNLLCCYAFAPTSRAGAVEGTIKPTLLRVATEGTIDVQKGTDTEKKELSYASILKAIDESHHNDATQACTYLPDETQIQAIDAVDAKPAELYQSHPTLLKEETVHAIRSAARNFFEQRGDNWGLQDVVLDELLSEGSEWKKELDDAVTKVVSLGSSKLLTNGDICNYLCWWRISGSCSHTTALERDSGMITAHIDLGTDEIYDEANQQNKAMGGLFMESLVNDALVDTASAVVGPLTPGQLVVHRSMERTAAMILPSNLHEIEAESKEHSKQSGLDNPTRTKILKTAETARHYCLRLTLTVKNNENQEEIAEHLLRKDDRVRYLTLAGIIDVDDYENHLWLGFDYSARANTEDEVDISQRMSDINKAIFHLQKAAELCPNDARVPFQLGNAFVARNSMMDQAGEGTEQYADLSEQQLCKMGEFDSAVDVISSGVNAPEDLASHEPKSIPKFEWIKAGERDVAITTYGDTAVFDEDDIYEGNREVHLMIVQNDPALKERMDNILQEKIYPLVREAFKDQGDNGGHPPPLGALSVYDSIFVRYNGDVARKAGRIGASQPLHQDGDDDPVNGFTGGGTFVEALSVGDDETVRRPASTGHALLHRTTQRHAGAPTTSGIRDILVIFLTARRPETPINNEYTYGIETAMRLQTMAKELPREQCLRGLELARSYDPLNSEMSYWLGVHLLQGDPNDPSDERWEEICRGVETLEAAAELNPADARAYYHLGMAISTRHKYAMRTKRAHLLPPAADAASRMIETFEEAIRLEKICEEAGCKNGFNVAASYLTLGEFMARLRNFDKAMEYLSLVEGALASAGGLDTPWAGGFLEEMNRMKSYCETETAKLSENAVV
ncbi:tetratricopeptide repeat-containing protein [Skeletonema marinoi]|uniref:Tetratricopeptide repeat-containing protein n=1 Tax=Skeletonema marinoi TaxID=267567 RepID=A0AAD8XZ70_9STRA|nr:tetratricopeptide repeat-containing protein [Skeletonema marinoi]